jgi:hypothetical protein
MALPAMRLPRERTICSRDSFSGMSFCTILPDGGSPEGRKRAHPPPVSSKQSIIPKRKYLFFISSFLRSSKRYTGDSGTSWRKFPEQKTSDTGHIEKDAGSTDTSHGAFSGSEAASSKRRSSR